MESGRSLRHVSKRFHLGKSRGTHFWGMAESQPSERPPWWNRHRLMLTALGVSLIVLLAYSVLAVTVLPSWIVSMSAGPQG